jgi:predicted HTH transcriptional regulator
MTNERPAEFLVSLVQELCKLPHETEWVEFKVNEADPQNIGEYVSALANSAALTGKAFAYLVWGVADDSHTIVGTSFVPGVTKIGNEELENWLLRLLAPKVHFRFFELQIDSKPVILLEIERAYRQVSRSRVHSHRFIQEKAEGFP